MIAWVAVPPTDWTREAAMSRRLVAAASARTARTIVPTAQNVFLFSSQFRMPANAARDIIFLSSLLSFPAILLISLLLH